jgi:hypothetical protein
MRKLLLVALLTPLAAQNVPHIVSLSPEHLSAEVDAKTTTKLTVVFDEPMDTSGWSFCGGGPKYPKTKGKPEWKNSKTISVDVELEPDHDYVLSLNCPAASNFRSAAGMTLPPTPWSFSTLPLVLPKTAEQGPRNEKALSKLTKTLEEHYAYYDLRVKDWGALLKQHRRALLAAKTDKSFASEAARMLAATEDLHLWLRLGDSTFATGTRAVDPLFRQEALTGLVSTRPAGEGALRGHTDDDIGYLLITGWNKSLDLAAIDAALADMRGSKAMIVDVRPNSGGDELLAQRVAAWFVDGDKVYAKNRYRERAGKNGFGAVLERRIAGNTDAEKHFNGPIAVLTSRYVMSSNESFVMMLRQSKDCTVIGQPTFGSSGNPKPFELGNGVTLFVPSWQDLRPDGTCFEGEGLAPDVLVEATPKDFPARDPILEKALAVLRAKIGK